jgi:hypothetical protein
MELIALGLLLKRSLLNIDVADKFYHPRRFHCKFNDILRIKFDDPTTYNICVTIKETMYKEQGEEVIIMFL